ncbi:DASS family sodium-coupled anion symporter [Arcobacter sp. CECT 8985]|uniref:DASS family sodium-coupled anion symporter n=1 Tax=Arcobacter sp. CECT 8985 TaxID=1935424 RepID=UPI00100B02E9|nr:DASS family sodium-coupled anion symporter [Arcobacter sp. CECT 8985]RXJ85652.1 anion permease [Arcobacter sp. CECT 8985]
MNKQIKIIPLCGIFFVGLIAWFFPPQSIDANSWHTLIVFLCTIVGIVLNVMPIGAVGLLGVTVFALTAAAGAQTSKQAIMDALSGFDSYLIWLIVVAFFIAKGFIKTGFGKRIALIMVKFFGKKTLGLVYGLSIADLILAPATPSNTARCGGVIYPIANALSQSFKSLPNDPSRKKMGTYLITSIGNINDITAAMFITAYAANPLIVKLAEGFGVKLSWIGWFVAAVGPAIISLILVPIALYFIIKPEIKHTPEAKEFAQAELEKLGPVSRDEKVMALTFIGVLILWIFGKQLGIHSTTTALIGLSSLIITGVLTWDDIKGEKAAWDTLVWFSALLMMATFLNKLGFTQWFGNTIGEELKFMASVNWIIILGVLTMIYTYTHYFFASGTAQVAALYSVFLGVGIKLGIPAYPLALLLGFTSSLYCSLTQYTHARGPILFGSGFVTTKEWWSAGFAINLLNQVIFLIAGLAWWKIIGLY